ncbi:hypothetical protein [Rufibacter sp. LB8]|uniref:hypothetical protein n=1 Tax=Rufibacter sp. LB8 TaxID=2777781 RepID=UPI00178C7AEA|nr:hypothetical protein [Rufibacter sp. LB8]
MEKDLAFLQSLYAQDTLYVIPEQQPTELVPGFPLPSAPEPVAPSSQELTMPVSVVTTESEAPAPAVIQKETVPIAWLGEAVKGTYLLFDVPEDVFAELPQHLFLQKVMAAVGLTTGQIRFGNLSKSLVHDIKEIAATQNARQIILFGQDMPVANLDKMEFYRMYKFNETRFVLADALTDIEQDTALKTKLWEAMKKIFLQ